MHNHVQANGLLIVVFLVLSFHSALAHAASNTQDVKLTLSADKVVSFATKKVTWPSLSVAPSGETLVLEILGDLYQLPISGGEALPLLAGMSFDSQPAYSPDGQMIAFVSDRSGNEDVWLYNLADQSTRQLTTSNNRDEVMSPSWSPDGKTVIVSKGSWLQRTNELWAFPIDGGSGVRITKAKPRSDTPANKRSNAVGAVYDPTGRYLYYARKQGGFGYNLRLPLWQLARRDLREGREDIISQAQGSAFRPVVSPDGRWLVYATRYQQHTGLRIRELNTGVDEWLAYPVSRDEQESRFTRDLFPGYGFTPDSSAVIASRDGDLIRINVSSKKIQVIPLHAQINKEVVERLAFNRRVGIGPVKARVLADPQLSPDGDRVAFASLARIYVHHFTEGKTVAISPEGISAAMPAWSPSGKQISYVGWSEAEGAIYTQRPTPRSKPKMITRSPGYYTFPMWSRDGKRIVALRGSATSRASEERAWGQVRGADLVWLDSKGGQAKVIMPARGLSRPHFGLEDDRVYLYITRSPFQSDQSSGLVSVRFDGSDRREHLTVTGAGIYSAGDRANPEMMYISPQGGHVVLKHANQLYVVQMLAHLQRQHVKLSKPSLPLIKITDVGADFVSWSPTGQDIVWSSGDRLFRRSLASIRFESKQDNSQSNTDVAAVLESIEGVQATGLDIYLPRSMPAGKVALVHGRIVTMSQADSDGYAGIVADGTIIVSNDRITEVGDTGVVEVPAGAHVIDLGGKTVTPGLIDTHAHYGISNEVYDDSEWSLLANLAYGVTAGMDVQPSTVDLLDVEDRVAAGLMLGPRAFSTGPGVFNNNNFTSYQHALNVLTRYKERYRVHNLKAYISGSRQQRQWLVQAARTLKLMPTTEGSLDMKLDLTHSIDGFSGLEHSYPVPKLQKDVVEFAARTNIAYTPTLLVVFGGPSGENKFYTEENPYKNAKLRRYIPYEFLASRSLRRAYFHPDEYITKVTAASAKRIVDAGGQVGVGAHGQLQGLGYHWEMWALAEGGFDNLEVLRSATIMGARMLGIDQDLGSLEVGKLADLVVYDRSPIDNLRYSTNISYVMKGGVLYEGNTLDQIWPESKKLPDQWWWKRGPKENSSGGAQ